MHGTYIKIELGILRK